MPLLLLLTILWLTFWLPVMAFVDALPFLVVVGTVACRFFFFFVMSSITGATWTVQGVAYSAVSNRGRYRRVCRRARRLSFFSLSVVFL